LGTLLGELDGAGLEGCWEVFGFSARPGVHPGLPWRTDFSGTRSGGANAVSSPGGLTRGAEKLETLGGTRRGAVTKGGIGWGAKNWVAGGGFNRPKGRGVVGRPESAIEHKKKKKTGVLVIGAGPVICLVMCVGEAMLISFGPVLARIAAHRFSPRAGGANHPEVGSWR